MEEVAPDPVRQCQDASNPLMEGEHARRPPRMRMKSRPTFWKQLDFAEDPNSSGRTGTTTASGCKGCRGSGFRFLGF